VTLLLKNLPRKTSIANLIPRNTNLGTQYQENLQFLNNEIVGEEALLDQYNHLAGEWAYEIRISNLTNTQLINLDLDDNTFMPENTCKAEEILEDD
jgi:hypothetical protein